MEIREVIVLYTNDESETLRFNTPLEYIKTLHEFVHKYSKVAVGYEKEGLYIWDVSK